MQEFERKESSNSSSLTSQPGEPSLQVSAWLARILIKSLEDQPNDNHPLLDSASSQYAGEAAIEQISEKLRKLSELSLHESEIEAER